jgi:uncharacterized protein (UPF0254 family)
MANELFTTNGNMEIKYRRKTYYSDQCDKLCFTLHNQGKQIGKATITADQLESYILAQNTLSNVPENIKNFFYLLKDIEKLLQSAPDENDCSDKENAVYTDLANLKQSLFDYLKIY